MGPLSNFEGRAEVLFLIITLVLISLKNYVK